MINPFFVLPAKAAKFIIVRTEDSCKVFPESMQKKIFTSLETCMEDNIVLKYKEKKRKTFNQQLRLIYTGRLIPTKALEIVIRAIATMKYKDKIIFTIVGKGKLKKSLVDLCDELGIREEVRFIDYLPRLKLLDMLVENDLYVFPSLKEGGSWALMEAMALGLPPICHDLSGMHLIASEKSAWMIPAEGIKKSIRRFSEVMDYCVEHPDEVVEKGRVAHNRIAHGFIWQSKDAVIESVLNNVKNDE